MSDKNSIIKTAGITAERKIRIAKTKEFREEKLKLLKALTEKIEADNDKAGKQAGKAKKPRNSKA